MAFIHTLLCQNGKETAAGWVVRSLSKIKDRRTQKEKKKLLGPLLGKQVLSTHLGKTPFEPTPNLLLCNSAIYQGQRMILLLMEEQWDYLGKNMDVFRLC